jgi:hypothetical protein
MAIDYVIDYGSIPKDTLGTQGILDRLKGRARAQAVIRLFRQNGDNRPPSEMGFELTRSLPDGEEETRVIVVQALLDEAAALDPLAFHCADCPANATGEAFGCVNAIQYPLSAAGEVWLLKQLPTPDEPLPWMILRQTVEEMGYTGASVEPLRASPTYFRDQSMYSRDLGEFQVTTNQIFEMIFMLGHIQPAHAGVLLMLFGAIPRDMEAAELMAMVNRTLSTEELHERYPFLLKVEDDDDNTTAELKQFFKALYLAWSLNVRLLLDV